MSSQRKRHWVSVPLVAFTLISIVLIAYYQNTLITAYSLSSENRNGDYKFGRISSVQNDENGNPAWIISGVWKNNLATNQSDIGNQRNETYPWHTFSAQFEMVLINGTAAHTHTVTNFIASNFSQQNNSTII